MNESAFLSIILPREQQPQSEPSPVLNIKEFPHICFRNEAKLFNKMLWFHRIFLFYVPTVCKIGLETTNKKEKNLYNRRIL